MTTLVICLTLLQGHKRTLIDGDEPATKRAPSSDTPSPTATESPPTNESPQECNVDHGSTSTTFIASSSSNEQ